MLWKRRTNGQGDQEFLNNPPRLETPRLYLRPALSSDYDQWANLRHAGQEYLREYEPQWPQDALSEAFFERRRARLKQDWIDDRAYGFLIFRKDDDALLGGININNVTRGAACFASIGYWIGEWHQGRGYMKEGAGAAIDFAFESLSLARINAACLPHNVRSKNLLLSLGFVEEGFAKKYIQINGSREDHILFGLNAPNKSA